MISATHPRRTFLKAGTAVAIASLLPAFPGLAAEARIPIGFLGVTHSHGREKLRQLLASPDFEVVGVCEEKPAGRKIAEELGAKLIPLEGLLEKSRVIAVESDVRDHARHALLALKAGKHVHLEKPAAATLREMLEIAALAREQKLLLQLGYMWRYHPGFDAIFEAVRNGWLGEVFMVRGCISSNVPAERRPEWAEFSGGGMFELGSHLLDAAVRLLGKPQKITPILRHHGRFNDALKDNNVAVLEFGAALAVITNSTLQPNPQAGRVFEVIGTKGSALLQPIEPPELKLDLAAAAGPYKKGVQSVPMPKYTRYTDDFIDLAAAVRGQKPLKVSLDEEVTTHQAILQACGME